MHLQAFKTIGLLAVLASPFARPADAGTLSASGIFSQFNAVVFGNFTTTSDVEGRLAVGGDLTGGASFNTKPSSTTSSYSAVTVYGNATSAGTYNIDNGTGVTIAGNNTASFNLNGGGTAYIGGGNSGGLSASNGSGSLTVIGANAGTLQLNSGGSVYAGAGSSAGISANGRATVAINGNNNANLTLNGGGTLALAGSNFGTISLNGGSISYTGSQSGNLNLNGGATASKVSSLHLIPPANTLGSFAATFQTPLTGLSAQLNDLAATATARSTGNVISFNAPDGTTGVAVFDIDASLFTANSTVRINLGDAASAIVNVRIDDCGTGACGFSLPNSVNFANPTASADKVLWNFVNATKLTFGNEFAGSVLAPLAAVSSSSPIDGTLVAASFAGSGELHSYSYIGILPGTATLSAAPEPTTLALIGTGLAGLATLRRRRRDATHAGISGAAAATSRQPNSAPAGRVTQSRAG